MTKRVKKFPLFPQQQPEAIQGMPAHQEPDDDDELNLDSACPNCGVEYDMVDYEYQICHVCKFNNN